MDRRNFLKSITVPVAAMGVAGCSAGSNDEQSEKDSLGEMTYRTTPKGDKVSLLGYGCMRWPRVKNPEKGENVCDQEAVNELVDYAIEHGVNYFDTSPAYMQGWSERTMGEALKRHPRDSFYIATKMSNFNKASWSFESSKQIYENSLKYLQVDYIDYMLLHVVGNNTMPRFVDNGILDFLMKERDAGRIRNLGFSFHGDVKDFDYMLANHDKYKWDFVQIQLNYLDWDYANKINKKNVNAEYLYGELHKRKIPVVIMEPLLGGRLASVPEYMADKYKKAEPNKSIASWAFRYAGNFPDVICVLSGMTYLEHLQDNLKSFSPHQPLSKENLELLDESARLIMEYNAIPCNDCKYCMPCPEGLDIPAILLHYNKCIFEENVIADPNDPRYAKARREFLIGYDRSVPKLRQVNRCIGCGVCIPHCPQGIDIVKELHKIDKYVEELKQNKNGF